MWLLKNEYRNYTPEEILHIFREEHRLSSFLDPEVDCELEITKDTTIREWRRHSNLLPWPELYKAENQIFNIDLPYETWKKAVFPENKKFNNFYFL